VLVLFSGGRGSGKSTIAKSLYEILDKTNYDYTQQSKWRTKTKNTYQKLFWILYFLNFFKFQVCNVFFKRLYRDINSGRAKGSLGRIYMPCVLSYHINKLFKKKVQCVIYESDFLTWAADKVLDDTFDSSEIKNYYSSVIIPRVSKILVVVCYTPVNVAFERWCIREGKQLSQYEKKKWIEKRTSWMNARNEVIKTVSGISNVTVMTLDGLDTPLQNSSMIAKILDRYN